MNLSYKKSIVTGLAIIGLSISSMGVIAEEAIEPGKVNADTAAQTDDAQDNQGITQKLEDAAMTARVKSRLIFEKRTSALDINVDTHLNEVTLKGTVQSETERVLAERIARETKGVRKVQNHLKVAGIDDGGMTKMN